jgi:MFS transporter, DHA1 family, inner membrane transport protein
VDASQTQAPPAPPFPWLGLLILAGAIFVSVTSEFLPTGLLPEMAEGLDVSQSRVGLLVTIFAGTVVVSAAPLTTLTRRFRRKDLVVIVLVVFALTNFIAAVAQSYEIVAASRVLGGLAHGLFWAVVGAYAGHMVPRDQLARAVAVTAAGATVAFVLGVPLGTALGHALGWRAAFTLVGAVILVLTVLVMKFLPRVNHIVELRTGEIPLPLTKDPSILGVVLVCAITTVLMSGQNIFYTYIVPFFTTVNGFGREWVGGLLLIYGLAGAIGLFLVGAVGGRLPRAGLIGGFSLVGLAVLTLGLFPANQPLAIAALVLWGAAFGGTPALLQTRLLRAASRRLRDVSSAYFTTSFNIGIGGGAFIGGLLLDAYGLGVLPFVQVGVTVAGIAFVIFSELLLRRQMRT